MLNGQRGFAVFTYLLGTLGMIGVLAAVMTASSNRASSTDRQWVASAQIVAQANLLRMKILDCALLGGDNGTANHPAYPGGTAAAVVSLTCPGRGGQNLFTGTDGIYLPPTPTADFDTAWRYTNNAAGVTIHLRVMSNPAGYANALAYAQKQFGAQARLATTAVANDTFELTITE